MIAATRTLPPSRDADDPELALAASIHGLMRALLHRVQPTLESQGLSMGRFWTLHLVSSLPEPTLSEVARHLGVRSPSACTSVDALARAGLVRRQRSERDRRIVALELTPEGRRAEATIWRAIGRALKESGRSIPSDDLATTIRVFRELRQGLDASSEAGR